MTSAGARISPFPPPRGQSGTMKSDYNKLEYLNDLKAWSWQDQKVRQERDSWEPSCRDRYRCIPSLRP